MSELLNQFRQQNPDYRDVPDDKLADGLYRKFYAGQMDRSAFDAKVGVDVGQESEPGGVDDAGGFQDASEPPQDAGILDSDTGDSLGFARHMHQGVSANFGDELIAGIQATLSPLVHGDRGMTWDERNDFYKDYQRGKLDDYQQKSPGKALGAQVLGAIPTMMVPVGAVGRYAQGVDKVGGAVSLGKRALASGGIAGGYGGAYSFGGSQGGAKQRAKDAMVGGALAIPFGVTAPIAGDKLGKLYQSLKKGSAIKAAAKNAPSTERLREAKTTAYNARDAFDTQPATKELQRFVPNLQADLLSKGYRPRLDDVTRRTLADYGAIATTPGDPATYTTIRQMAQGVAGNMDSNTSRLGKIMVDKVDDFTAQSAPVLHAANKKANELNRRYMRSKDMDKMREKAIRQASGEENGLRLAADRMLNNDKIARYLSPDEKLALEKVSLGGPISNTLRTIGKVGFGSGKSGNALGGVAGLGTGYAAGDQMGLDPTQSALLAAILTGGARYGATRMARGRADLAQKLMASGGSAPVTALPQQRTRLVEELLRRAAPVTTANIYE